MKKMVWVLIIAAGVFLGVFAYEKFTGQEIQKSQQLDLGGIQDELQGIETDQKKHQQAEVLAKSAVCTISADDNSCSCINPDNSEEIALADDECVARANERPN
jgi:hypothetical protein